MKDIAAYLAKDQAPIQALFARARRDQRWSHAYLLHGNVGQPLFATATYLAQSLLCENPSPLACGQCLTCQRFDHHDYADIIMIDGSETSIKKQDVLEIASRFSLTGLEKASKQIYVLHRVEFMTPEAINALLKFLEEPQLEIYAIMTSENLDAVLPTIQSRSQVIHFKPTNQTALILDAIQAGISEKDAQLLSFETSTLAAIKSASEDQPFQLYQQHLHVFCQHWIKDVQTAQHYFRQDWLPTLDDLSLAKQWLNRWITIIHELSKLQQQQSIILKAYGSMLLGIASRIPNPFQTVKALESRLQALDKSTNLPLFLEATLITLLGVI